MSTTRIILAGFLIAAVTALVVGLCAVGDAHAAGPEPQTSSTCSSCHADRAKQWETGNPAKAFTDPAFKSAWDNSNNQKYCLACHTTGYDANTGKYVEEGIDCTACHKPGPNGHPNGPMSVSDSAEFCGACHTTTLHEWQKSGHGQANLACASCHDMHSTSLRFKTPADLCSSCHQERNSQAGMPMNQVGLCTDCHMYTTPGNSRVEGKAPTGHSFILGSDACQRGHGKDIHAAHQILTTDTPKAGTDKVIATPVPTPDAASGAVSQASVVPVLPGIAGGALGGLLLGFVAATDIVGRNR